ncbi:MAG: hypothetical protein CL609_17515 [Anaerolineaceae bacterium]|nr:hypothetical protein [Anaerolineaceae bacterium]
MILPKSLIFSLLFFANMLTQIQEFQGRVTFQNRDFCKEESLKQPVFLITIRFLTVITSEAKQQRAPSGI